MDAQLYFLEQSHTLAPTSNTVLLRAEPGNKDPIKRKSGTCCIVHVHVCTVYVNR